MVLRIWITGFPNHPSHRGHRHDAKGELRPREAIVPVRLSGRKDVIAIASCARPCWESVRVARSEQTCDDRGRMVEASVGEVPEATKCSNSVDTMALFVHLHRETCGGGQVAADATATRKEPCLQAAAHGKTVLN